jgi:hypothetical protein
MGTKSAAIHRKMPMPARQLPITGFAHKAAVVGNGRVGTGVVLATQDVPAEGCRAAALDGAHHFELAEAHVTAVGITPSGAVVAEDIRGPPGLDGPWGRRYAGGPRALAEQ